MSESTVPAPSESGSRPGKSVSEIVIRIAGNSQDGIQSIGGFLARLAGRSEQDVMTFMTIPSTISGGPSIFQVRIGTGDVLSAGDEADVLLAFYQHSYEGHIAHLRPGGIVLYDSDHVEVKDEWRTTYSHVGIPISTLTIEAIGGTAKDKGKNIFALGLIAKVFSLETEKLLKLVHERFGGKGDGVLENALNAFHAGAAYEVGDLMETFSLSEPNKRDKDQVVTSGNEALAYGLIAAGIRFGAGYPITPWSDIMELLRRELPKYGGMFVQCEDEIASVSMAIGASYAGRVSVTGSSGPGIALKSEAIGWAVMAEVPLIVCDIQRGGPSTGLPTSIEQSDLNIACFGGHGDSPRVVIAPCDVEDCFYTAIEAVNIAKKYSVPVFILSDQSIATRIEAFAEPDLQSLCQEIGSNLSPVSSHKPYDLSSPDGIVQHLPPGTRIQDGKYPVITGLEHDEMGHPSGAPKMHMQMTAKRRSKIQKLSADIPLPQIHGPDSGDVLLVGWGSTWGPILEAVKSAAASPSSVSLSAINMRHLNPMPDRLGDILEKFQHVYVVETNDGGIYGYGQLCMLMRARFCNPKIQGINKTDGLTFKVREILNAVSDKLALTTSA